MICNSSNTVKIHTYKYWATTDGVDEGAIKHLHQGLALGLNPNNGHGLGELDIERLLGRDEAQMEVGLALDALTKVAFEYI